MISTNKKEPVAGTSGTSKWDKLEDEVELAWRDYSLDAPRLPNPIPCHTRELRRMCFIVNLVLPIVKICFGAIYIDSCPVNDLIPIYELVGGTLELTFLIILSYKPLRQVIFSVALGLSIIIWHIISSINIFVEWEPDYFLGGWRYCDMNLYYFAFFVSVGEYVILAVLLLYVCTQFAYVTNDDTPCIDV